MYQGERLNSIIHLLGAVLALAGAVVLVVFASLKGDVWRIVSFSIYGITLFLLYVISTMYHSLKGQTKVVFQTLDHIAIYLLIAGTYTPYTLVSLNGSWGWTLFGVVWGLAIFGIILDSLHRNGPRIIQMIIYFLMGWLMIIAFRPLLENLPTGGVIWLVTGGLFYTVGIIFYVLDNKMRHAHAVWHLFVLAGSSSHYISIFVYVL
ncbi:MAG: hemolysin III family protein [Gammaproteobacteria bacterium]|nr:hemolysin III family protein [Gammaproteobacteria bacterium]